MKSSIKKQVCLPGFMHPLRDTNTNINTSTNTNVPWFALFSVFLSARSLYLDLLSLWSQNVNILFTELKTHFKVKNKPSNAQNIVKSPDSAWFCIFCGGRIWRGHLCETHIQLHERILFLQVTTLNKYYPSVFISIFERHLFHLLLPFDCKCISKVFQLSFCPCYFPNHEVLWSFR